MNNIIKSLIVSLIVINVSSYSYAAGDKFYPKNINIATQAKKDVKINYEFKAEYPQLTNFPNLEVRNKVNQDIINNVNKQNESFLKQSNEYLKDDPEGPKANVNELGISYNTYYLTNDIFSYLLNVFSIFNGSAHGSYYMVSYNYDLKTGNLIQLKDLFKDKVNYLKILSDYTTTALKAKGMVSKKDGGWLEDGTAPKIENFSSWNINKNSLIIHFQNYQVASYADGPQEVIIPLSKLKEYLK